MRHKISGNRLNRNRSLRKATMRDLAKATLIQERICTTKAKAKEARKLVDQLITLGKNGTLADKRRAFAILCDHKLVSTLFKETSSRFKNRVGGYSRIIALGTRRGDSAQMAYLELTEKKEIVVSKPKTSASAKKGAAAVKPVKEKAPAPAAEDVKVETKDIAKEKEHHVKKDEIKTKSQKSIASQKDKPGGKFFGGIRKMFNRKSSGK